MNIYLFIYSLLLFIERKRRKKEGEKKESKGGRNKET